MQEVFEIIDLMETFSIIEIDLFPIGYELIDQNKLIESINLVTYYLNRALDHYHTLTILQEKAEIRPILKFSQVFLNQICRLLRFEPIHLTKFNQILVDTYEMLINRHDLITNVIKKQSDNELKILNDEKFKKMLKNSFEFFYQY